MIFSRSGSHQAPRRSSWKRRGAFFCAGLAAGGGLLIVSSRALPHFSIFPDSGAALVARDNAQKRVLEAKRNRSLGAALSKIDAQTVRAWVNRWTSSDGAPTSRGPRLVRIDAEILAHHHPAWILADDLERGAIAPSAPQIAQEMGGKNSASVNQPALLLANEFNVTRSMPAITWRENTGVSGTRARQNAALEGFLSAAAARDALRGRDEAWLSRRALEDAIAASGRGAVPELDLTLVSPEMALELTNLRLQLLRNLSKTPAQRDAARQEIRAIEARYARLLSEETARQAARLREARLEIPLRQRREGLQKIAIQTQQENRARAASRLAVALENRERLRRDFRFSAPLSLELQPAQVLSQQVLSPPDFAIFATSKKRSVNLGSQFFETATPKAASQAPIRNERIRNERVLAISKPPAPAVVALLRRKARTQAQEWARLVAGNWGAIRSDAPHLPDATSAALKILFPLAKR
ncbi:hypothetical protein B1R32_102256 [Abditibacterium utsteinense]|uniref:Uncharacterized protein n=1 Tax=Abditibacterium utsteinense TaxID=1960156 RepID=A0A2S8SWT2_9BACT|nr:hypothetical protein [Abditibacterium utsteinense]PQV65247.1 hypothetical protein B1R32_102256 [Abditibacterium utsteinense]